MWLLGCVSGWSGIILDHMLLALLWFWINSANFFSSSLSLMFAMAVLCLSTVSWRIANFLSARTAVTLALLCFASLTDL